MVLIRLWIELRFRQRMLHSFLAKCYPALDMMWTLWISTKNSILWAQVKQQNHQIEQLAIVPLTVCSLGWQVNGRFDITWTLNMLIVFHSTIRCEELYSYWAFQNLPFRLKHCSQPVFERMGYLWSDCHFVLRYLSLLHRSTFWNLEQVAWCSMNRIRIFFLYFFLACYYHVT